jgi:sugar phosphate isomerase/epimerase
MPSRTKTPISTVTAAQKAAAANTISLAAGNCMHTPHCELPTADNAPPLKKFRLWPEGNIRFPFGLPGGTLLSSMLAAQGCKRIEPAMVLTRRDLSAVAIGAAFGITAAQSRALRKIGLQLYTVRDLLKRDFDATLRDVALLGYREVEFAGILGDDVGRTRHLLRSLDLTSPSLHADYTSLRSNPEKSFETAHLLEARFVVCPWLDPPERQTADDWKRICDNLNAIGERAARAGLVLAYHNHDFEFADLAAGVRPYDLLLSRTDEPLVKFELDVYWATRGKVDPAPLLRAHPSRFRLVHLKDMARDGSFTEIGNGTLDFADIIDAALQSGVEHFFVEQDVAPDPLRSIAASIAYLRRLG